MTENRIKRKWENPVFYNSPVTWEITMPIKATFYNIKWDFNPSRQEMALALKRGKT